MKIVTFQSTTLFILLALKLIYKGISEDAFGFRFDPKKGIKLGENKFRDFQLIN